MPWLMFRPDDVLSSSSENFFFFSPVFFFHCLYPFSTLCRRIVVCCLLTQRLKRNKKQTKWPYFLFLPNPAESLYQSRMPRRRCRRRGGIVARYKWHNFFASTNTTNFHHHHYPSSLVITSFDKTLPILTSLSVSTPTGRHFSSYHLFFFFYTSFFLCYYPCYNIYYCHYYYFKGIFTSCSSPCTFKKKVTSFLSFFPCQFLSDTNYIRRRACFSTLYSSVCVCVCYCVCELVSSSSIHPQCVCVCCSIRHCDFFKKQNTIDTISRAIRKRAAALLVLGV